MAYSVYVYTDFIIVESTNNEPRLHFNPVANKIIFMTMVAQTVLGIVHGPDISVMITVYRQDPDGEIENSGKKQDTEILSHSSYSF